MSDGRRVRTTQRATVRLPTPRAPGSRCEVRARKDETCGAMRTHPQRAARQLVQLVEPIARHRAALIARLPAPPPPQMTQRLAPATRLVHHRLPRQRACHPHWLAQPTARRTRHRPLPPPWTRAETPAAPSEGPQAPQQLLQAGLVVAAEGSSLGHRPPHTYRNSNDNRLCRPSPVPSQFAMNRSISRWKMLGLYWNSLPFRGGSVGSLQTERSILAQNLRPVCSCNTKLRYCRGSAECWRWQ